MISLQVEDQLSEQRTWYFEHCKRYSKFTEWPSVQVELWWIFSSVESLRQQNDHGKDHLVCLWHIYIYMDLWPSFTVMCWYLAVLSTISGYSRDIEYKLKQTFQNQCKLVQCRYYIAFSIALYCICHMLRLNVISHCCWRDVITAGHQSWLKFLQPLIAAWPKFAKHTKKMHKRFPHTSKKHKPM